MFPKRREDLKRFPALVLDSPGFVQERGVETFDLNAGLAQLTFHVAVTLDRGGFIATVPKDRVRSGLPDKFTQDLERRTLTKDHSRTASVQIALQRSEGMMHPPTRSSTGRPGF